MILKTLQTLHPVVLLPLHPSLVTVVGLVPALGPSLVAEVGLVPAAGLLSPGTPGIDVQQTLKIQKIAHFLVFFV